MLRTQQQEMAANKSNVEILSRLSSLPTVNSALTFATNTYSNTKDRNVLLKYALGSAEKSVFAVAKTAEPIVNILQTPIHVVDDIACKGLDKLEATLPVIKKTPEEIVDDTKLYYNKKVEASVNKYNEAKEYGVNQVFNLTDALFKSYYGQAVAKQVNKSLDFADNYVDYMISHSETKDSEGEPIENPAVKAAMIYQKLKMHAYKNTSSRVTELGKSVQDIVANLNFAMLMMDYVKKSNANFANEKFNQMLSDAKERVNAIWVVLTEEDDSHISEKKNMAEKLLYISRRLTKQLIFSFNYVVSTTQSLPESVNDRLKLSQEYVSDMHSYFTKVTGIEEINKNISEQFRPKVEYIQNSLVEMSKNPIISQALSVLSKETLNKETENTAESHKETENTAESHKEAENTAESQNAEDSPKGDDTQRE